jgi:hypothetical protein
MSSQLSIHPAADLFPAMSDEEYGRLRDDIAKNGQIMSIATYKGQVLDGRHRYRACLELGIEPKLKEYDGGDPVGIKYAHTAINWLAKIPRDDPFRKQGFANVVSYLKANR